MVCVYNVYKFIYDYETILQPYKITVINILNIYFYFGFCEISCISKTVPEYLMKPNLFVWMRTKKSQTGKRKSPRKDCIKLTFKFVKASS